ncbi:MAG TPA: class I SAM-dependent methyltransferase [Verrucomicrobiae bacterium]|nr:class I SAM-dependent methyltransferase [Verrucomicrobiae bacterium]
MIVCPDSPKEWPPNGLEQVSMCPVCQSAHRKLAYEGLFDRLFKCAPGRWNLYSCDDCGSAYLDPRPNQSTISLAYSKYYTHKQTDVKIGRWWRLWRIAQRNRYLNDHLGYNAKPAAPIQWFVKKSRQGRFRGFVAHLRFPGPGARFLDVGCGNGSFLMRMRSMGWDVCGVEPDPNSAQQARAVGLDVRVGQLRDSGLPERSIDAIHMSHVIEHLHDPAETLRLCWELLKPGGQIVIATPNFDAYGRSHFGPYWVGLDPPRHLVLFTEDSLINLLSNLGFEVSAVQRSPQRMKELFRKNCRLLEECQATGRPDVLPRKVQLASDRAAMEADRAARADSKKREEIILHGTKPIST